ncbi:hypothetical protein DVT68_15540 [Dyella solisilvae]|uniref:Uncharacterized protein n=1 Tax=Dyella solisilvae TaxID=1920168 RepID=A0A370K4X8_9GAMM|nr:hypothetical protein [Dyella solisilvae]RDI97694.1 hypothetical protein DVT68_15540 [Dyella solisilvae]
MAARDRESNRDAMPGTASLVDGLRAGGFDPKVLWCREGDRELGRREPFDGLDVKRELAAVDRKTRLVRAKRVPWYRPGAQPPEDEIR